MDDMCGDADCTDDAKWVLKIRDAAGKITEEQYCHDHMKTYAAQSKTDGKSVVGLTPYVSEDDEDADEDEDDEEDEDGESIEGADVE